MLRKYNIKPTKTALAERIRQAGRFEAFSARLPGLLLDFSRTSLDEDAFEKLLELIEHSGLEQARDALFAGEKVNFTEQRPVLHMAMRDDQLLAGVDGETARRVVEARQRAGFLVELLATLGALSGGILRIG